MSTDVESPVQRIVTLVNRYSPISEEITAERVKKSRYLLHEVDGVLAGCVKIERVSWYQWEISHLVVDPIFRSQGVGTDLVRQACQEIEEDGGRVAQCTVHEGSVSSERIFRHFGFVEGVRFIGITEKGLRIWQKAL